MSRMFQAESDWDRAEAVERLCALLEADSPRVGTRRASEGRDELGSLRSSASLMSARAARALATSPDVERIGPGAWFMRRPRRFDVE